MSNFVKSVRRYKNFLELKKMSNETILVNLDKVRYIYPTTRTTCRIVFDEDSYIEVNETYNIVTKLIGSVESFQIYEEDL